MDEEKRREQILLELARVEESAKYSAANQFALSQQWEALNLLPNDNQPMAGRDGLVARSLRSRDGRPLAVVPAS